MWRASLTLAIASFVAVACSTSDQSVPETQAGEANGGGGLTVEPGTPVGQPQTEPGAGEVKLWVSNQSFEDDPIGIAVSIDGVQVIDQQFEVQGQHNWIAFPIQGIEPGEHMITALSDTGAEHTNSFTVLADEPRWLVLDYWFSPGPDEPGGRHFTFSEHDRPVGFG